MVRGEGCGGECRSHISANLVQGGTSRKCEPVLLIEALIVLKQHLYSMRKSAGKGFSCVIDIEEGEKSVKVSRDWSYD